MTALLWTNTAASILGTWLVTCKRRIGFAVWTVTNTAWVAWNLAIANYPQAALFAVYLVLALYGWRHWRST